MLLHYKNLYWKYDNIIYLWANPLIFLESEEKNKGRNEEKDEKSEDGEKLELPVFSFDIYLDNTSLR